MDTCPVEIHSVIFSLACTDDGTTGRSLSLVSRHVRRVSEPFRWQSLSLLGLQQARHFVKLLKQTPGYHPVYHLFLSTQSPLLMSNDQYNMPRENPDKEWYDLLDIILRYTAPTLQTLSLYVTSKSHFLGAACIPLLLTIAFPYLVELTIWILGTPQIISWWINTSPQSSKKAAILPPTARPKLRRLHLACFFYFRDAVQSRDLHHIIQSLSSCITHLRLTMLDFMCLQTARIAFAECLDIGFVDPGVNLLDPGGTPISFRENTNVAVTWPRILPDSIQVFVIQMPPPSTARLPRGLEEQEIQQYFKALARAAPAHVVCISTQRDYLWEDAKADWLDRIEEGPGCWKERDKSWISLREDGHSFTQARTEEDTDEVVITRC
ncbi:predicted protein [Sparassis crispa]|uniref:Uncharacterized protein n=1 Tax=Sparassis crispa TaxID=139825 RepID=A0A401G545_9APHY|nr:predicted protein [Sparassis crispa]GBE77281.1 predicted protein [Sparassis crispa]